jgi:DNA-binding GntR family transcriptional regulator
MSMRRLPDGGPQSRPRYVEIADILLAEIADGRHGVGALLPTEHELCAAHGVSRATVREALRQLQARGLIARSQGIGTRVLASATRTNYVLTAQSATETMGYSAETRFVTRRRRMLRARPALARLLGAAAGSEWLHLSGVRLLTGEPSKPLAASDIYVAARYAALSDKADSASPIYALIEREHGVQITDIAQDINAVVLTATQARLLRAPAGSSGLHVVRRFIAADGQPVEVTGNIHPADRFTFSLRLHQPQG